MNLPHNKSVTLLELLIAITLISLVVLGLSSIDLFSRYHVLTSDKRAKLQNEVSYTLEHMTKEIGRAIGNELIHGANSVVNITTGIRGDETILRFYVDLDSDGMRDLEDQNQDAWRYYRFTGASGDYKNEIRYCPRCSSQTCTSCSGCANCNPPIAPVEVTLASKIIAFNPTKPPNISGQPLSDNYVDIQIQACWDPPDNGEQDTCGTPDNPTVTMGTRIKMPLVSTN